MQAPNDSEYLTQSVEKESKIEFDWLLPSCGPKKRGQAKGPSRLAIKCLLHISIKHAIMRFCIE